MNFELSGEIIKILDDLGRRFGIAIDWADKNIMPYVTELCSRFISYKIVTNIIPIALFIVLLCVNIWFWKKFYKCYVQAKKNDESNAFINVDVYHYLPNTYAPNAMVLILGIVFSILLLIFTSICISSVSTILKLVYIPEFYIIEYITQYIA